MPLISIILPVYKPQQEFLTLAIQSILNQTHQNLELIIIEDQSELTAEQIIPDFNDPRIKYILNASRTNFAEQINLGISLAKGDYIARMDADDISEPTRLSKQLNFLLSHQDISVLGSNLTIINENNKIIGKRFYPENSLAITKKMRLKNCLAHPSIMFKIVGTKNLLPLPTEESHQLKKIFSYTSEFNMLSDYDLWSRLNLAGYKFYNLQEPLLKYRLHQNASKTYSLKTQLQDTLKIKNKYFRFKTGWTLLAELRYWLEKFLLLLPNKIVYWLFIKTNIKNSK